MAEPYIYEKLQHLRKCPATPIPSLPNCLLSSKDGSKVNSSGGKKSHDTSLLRLPQELIRNIFARLAASSFTEFLAIKLICKDLCRLVKQEESYIYRHVSLENYPIVAWHNIKKQSLFFDKCCENKNPEALYRQGVVNYFGGARLECAINCLKEAANSGHLAARYALGAIFVLSGGAMKQEGVSLLADMKRT